MRTDRSWVWILAVAALAVGAACGDDDDDGDGTGGTGGGGGGGGNPPAAVSFEQQIHPVLVAKCAACHGDAWGSATATTSYQAARAKVDPANAAASPLYVRGNGGSGHTKALSDAEAQLVLLWIQQGATGPATTPPPPPPAAVSFSQQVHPFLVSSCGACHGAAWGSATVATSYAAAAQRVNTANPPLSPLYVRGTGGSGHANVLSSANAQTLLTWIQQGAQNN